MMASIDTSPESSYAADNGVRFTSLLPLLLGSAGSNPSAAEAGCHSRSRIHRVGVDRLQVAVEPVVLAQSNGVRLERPGFFGQGT